jgi:hypothetical protein
MEILKMYASALDAVFGLNKKPKCPICGLKHAGDVKHCDACELPFEVSHCKAEGCTAWLCKECHTAHAWEHM